MRIVRRRPEEEARRRFIAGYAFPAALMERVNDNYEPELDELQLSVVLQGLRAWFLACLQAGRKPLGMPSQAVDTAWHEFILMTREYHAFCERAFGRYLHHSPEATMNGSYVDALRRTLRILDREQPGATAGSVPFLFAVDSHVGLAEGNEWKAGELELLRAAGFVTWDPAAGLHRPGWEGCGAGCGGGGCGGD
jgi:hypothetical protein